MLGLSILCLIIGLIGVYVAVDLNKQRAKDIAKITDLQRDIKTLEESRKFLTGCLEDSQKSFQKELENNKTILSQKKSSETRMGQMTENIVPFLEAFPYDPKNAHFLGQPIDFVVFDYDDGKIVFVEVKTGNAKESARQKLIKNIIKSGRVYYEHIRVSPKGVKIKETKNNE